MEEGRFLAIVGASGSGKSSLVRAGLLPAIDDGFLIDESSDWCFVTMRPGANPYGQLAAEMHRSFADYFADSSGVREPANPGIIEATLRAGPKGISDAIDDAGTPEETAVLILVDQFEEIFRYQQYGQSREERSRYLDEAAAFVDMLLMTPKNPNRSIYVVLTMRSDFIGNCDTFLGLPEAISASQFLTPRLTRKQLEDAVTGPLRVFDWEAEPILVTEVLNDTGNEADHLPLMQHALMRTWLHAKSRQAAGGGPHMMLLEDYVAVGRLENALEKHAEEAWEELNPEGKPELTADQKIAEAIFRSLSERSEDRPLTRRVATLAEIEGITGHPLSRIQKVVEVFCKGHRNFLVRSKTEADGSGSLDISHESLLRQWERLGEWIDSESESASLYRELMGRVKKYEQVTEQKKKSELLWRRPDLDNALRWLRKEQPNESWARRYSEKGGAFANCIEFVEASKAARFRRRLWRQAKTAGALIGFVCFAAFGYRFAQKDAAKRNTIRNVLSVTELISQGQRFEAIFQLGEAIEEKGLTGAPLLKGNKRKSATFLISANSNFSPPIFHNANVWDACFSPDGSIVATGSQGGLAKLSDAKTGEEIARMKHWSSVEGRETKKPASARRVLFSPDGSKLLTTSYNFKAQLWDGRTGQDLNMIMPHDCKVIEFARFGTSGRFVYTGAWWLDEPDLPKSKSREAEARVWGIQGTTPILEDLFVLEERITALDVNSAETLVATAEGIGSKGVIKVWKRKADQTEQKTPAFELVNESPIIDLKFCLDDEYLVFSDKKHIVWIWNFRSEEFPASVAGHRGDPNALHKRTINDFAIYPIQTGVMRIVTGSEDQTSKKFDVLIKEDGTVHSENFVTLPLNEPADTVELSEDGGKAIISERDGTVRLWDLSSGTRLGVPYGHAKQVHAIEFSPEGDKFVTASGDNTARIWEFDSSVEEAEHFSSRVGSITDLEFAPDGLLVTCGRNGAQLWASSSETWSQVQAMTDLDSATKVLFAPQNPGMFVTGQEDGTVRFFRYKPETNNVEEYLSLRLGAAVTELSFDQSGTKLAVGTTSGGVVVVNWKSIPEQTELTFSQIEASRHCMTFVHKGRGEEVNDDAPVPVVDCSFHPDGRRLITTGEKTIRFWDIETGAKEDMFLPRRIKRRGYLYQGGPSEEAGLDASGDWLYTIRGDDRHYANIWYVKSAEVSDYAFESMHREKLSHGTFNPQIPGLFVSASSDGEIRRWEFGKAKRQIRNNEGQIVQEAALSHTAEKLVRGEFKGIASDKSGVLFAVATSEGMIEFFLFDGLMKVGAVRVEDLQREEVQVTDLEFHPGGTQLALATSDGRLRIIPVVEPAKDIEERLELSTRVRTGWTRDKKTGLLRQMKIEEWEEAGKKLQELGGFCDLPN